jgi:hypothetical protein
VPAATLPAEPNVELFPRRPFGEMSLFNPRRAALSGGWYFLCGLMLS